VVLNQIRLGALSPGEEGGLTRYVHATGAAPGSAMDAAYFKQARILIRSYVLSVECCCSEYLVCMYQGADF